MSLASTSGNSTLSVMPSLSSKTSTSGDQLPAVGWDSSYGCSKCWWKSWCRICCIVSLTGSYRTMDI